MDLTLKGWVHQLSTQSFRHKYGQGRRQEFFQGRALGGSRGGLPSHFSISRAGGAQPRLLVASMVKMNFRARGHGPLLPMPAYALEYG